MGTTFDEYSFIIPVNDCFIWTVSANRRVSNVRVFTELSFVVVVVVVVVVIVIVASSPIAIRCRELGDEFAYLLVFFFNLFVPHVQPVHIFRQMVVFGFYGACHFLHALLIFRRCRSKAVEVLPHSFVSAYLDVVALLRRMFWFAFRAHVFCAFKVRLFYCAADHIQVAFIFVDQFFEELLCILVALVVAVLPHDDVAFVNIALSIISST